MRPIKYYVVLALVVALIAMVINAMGQSRWLPPWLETSGDLYLNRDASDVDVHIYFGSVAGATEESLRWDREYGYFELSDSLGVVGQDLAVGLGSAYSGWLNIYGDDDDGGGRLRLNNAENEQGDAGFYEFEADGNVLKLSSSAIGDVTVEVVNEGAGNFNLGVGGNLTVQGLADIGEIHSRSEISAVQEISSNSGVAAPFIRGDTLIEGLSLIKSPTIQSGTYTFSTGNATLKGEAPDILLMKGHFLPQTSGTHDLGDSLTLDRSWRHLLLTGYAQIPEVLANKLIRLSLGGVKTFEADTGTKYIHHLGEQTFTTAGVWKNYGTSQTKDGTDGLFKSVVSSPGWSSPNLCIDGNSASFGGSWASGGWTDYLTVSPGSAIAQPEWISGIKLRGEAGYGDGSGSGFTADISIQTVDSGASWISVFNGYVAGNTVTTIQFSKREYVKYARVRLVDESDIVGLYRFDPIRHPAYYPVAAMSNASTIGVPIGARQFTAYGIKTGGTVTFTSEGFPAFKSGTNPTITLTPMKGEWLIVANIITFGNTGFTYQLVELNFGLEPEVYTSDVTTAYPVHWTAKGILSD